MVGPDEVLWLGMTGREIITLVTAFVLVVIVAYHRIRYKVWNWLGITLALILLSAWPIWWIIRYCVEGRIW